MNAALDARTHEIKPSATLAIQERCRELAARGSRVYRFGLGQSPFPVPELVVQALRDHASEKDYLPVKGLPALRAAVSDYHRRRMGSQAGPEDVLVAPGSKELMFLLQLVLGGDVLIPAPAWVSYAPQARILGKSVRFLPTTFDGGWLLTAEVLERACAGGKRPGRLLVLNYPGNPTGNTYGADELEALARVARREELIVLSDEIYGELHFRGEHRSIAQHYPEGTIIASGLSKWCGAGGWRLGTFTFDPRLRWLLEAMAAAASETYTSTSAPIQHAAVRAFEANDELSSYLTSVRRVLALLMTSATERLRSAGLRVVLPQGAFYLFVDASPLAERLAGRGIVRADDLAERVLQEACVAALPGSEFGLDPSVLALRLSLVDFSGAKALGALAAGEPLDEAFLERHCTACMEGVRALCDWFSSSR